MVGLEAVIFDFNGTLTPARLAQAQGAARSVLARALHIDVAALDAAMTASYRERFRGETGDVQQSLAWLARQLGARPTTTTLAAATEVRLAAERRFAQPRPEALPLLRELRERGLRIGVISDCTAELPELFAELPIAPLVDAAVFSCVTGSVKPDPDNYLACCHQLQVPPSSCWYVGDGGSNELHGARAVGMHPVHLDVPSERGGVVYGRHASWAGATIQTLTELLPLIEAHQRQQ
jgi:putative hydrolase of the HAD superfamily